MIGFSPLHCLSPHPDPLQGDALRVLVLSRPIRVAPLGKVLKRIWNGGVLALCLRGGTGVWHSHRTGCGNLSRFWPWRSAEARRPQARFLSLLSAWGEVSLNFPRVGPCWRNCAVGGPPPPPPLCLWEALRKSWFCAVKQTKTGLDYWNN